MKSQAARRILGRSVLYLKQKAPTILTGLGVVGVIGTAVLAVKETPKALKLIEEEKRVRRVDAIQIGESPYEVVLTKREVVSLTWRCYIPPMLLGASTIACIIGSHTLSQKAQASLSSALYLVSSQFDEYRGKVRELYSEDADKEIRAAIANDRFKEQNIEGVSEDELNLPSTLLTFYDEYSGRFFQKTEQEVMDAEYHLNRNFALRGYSSLNEFYEFLGLPETDYGEMVGWNIYAGEAFYGYTWIDFEHDLTSMADGSYYYFIHIPFGPTPDYMDY